MILGHSRLLMYKQKKFEEGKFSKLQSVVGSGRMAVCVPMVKFRLAQSGSSGLTVSLEDCLSSNRTAPRMSLKSDLWLQFLHVNIARVEPQCIDTVPRISRQCGVVGESGLISTLAACQHPPHLSLSLHCAHQSPGRLAAEGK